MSELLIDLIDSDPVSFIRNRVEQNFGTRERCGFRAHDGDPRRIGRQRSGNQGLDGKGWHIICCQVLSCFIIWQELDGKVNLLPSVVPPKKHGLAAQCFARCCITKMPPCNHCSRLDASCVFGSKNFASWCWMSMVVVVVVCNYSTNPHLQHGSKRSRHQPETAWGRWMPLRSAEALTNISWPPFGTVCTSFVRLELRSHWATMGHHGPPSSNLVSSDLRLKHVETLQKW